jgi:DNA-binding transcriptional MocR family regulator
MTSEPARSWDENKTQSLLSRRGLLMGPQVWGAAQAPPGKAYSLAGGLPDVPTLPGALLEEAIAETLREEPKAAMEYGGLYGAPTLREAVAAREGAKDGLTLGAENVLVTSGSAQAIHNVCDLFLDPGDVVLVENPHFPGTLRTIRAFGADMVGVPLDEEGVRVDDLESAIAGLRSEGRQPKFLYCMSNFQNPTGATMSLPRRKAIVDVCAREGVLIVEDDAYGDIWTTPQPPPPSLAAIAGLSGAVRIGTFSKSLATGLRVGFAIAEKDLIDRLASCRFDMGTSPFLSRPIARLVTSGSLDRHLEQVRPIYAEKLDRLVNSLHTHAEAYATWHKPAGGFFLWLALRPGLDAVKAARAAAEQGVMIGAGPAFFADGAYTNHLRLAFSSIPTDEIDEAVKRLAAALGDLAAGSAK